MFKRIPFTLCCLFFFAYHILSAQQPKLILPIGHTNFVDNACFYPDGKKVLTASADKTAKIWDAQSGALLADLKGHGGNVTCARISPDGKKIVTASNDGSVKLWSAESGQLLFDVKGPGEIVYDACFSPDSRKLATSGSDSIAADIWDAETGKLIMDLKKERVFTMNLCFSPDGNKILTSYAAMYADIWDAHSGMMLGELEGSIHWVNSYCFSPDGKKILTASRDHTVKIWDSDKRIMLGELKGHDKEVTRARFSFNGNYIVTASDDSSARIWNSETATLITTIRIPGKIFTDAVFSPDNKKIATLSGGQHPRIWDANTGSLIAELKDHAEGPYLRSVCFSSDGKKVLTASADYTAKMWNAQTGARMADLNGHSYEIYNARFSPDGKKIVTATTSNTPRIWDSETGVVIYELKGHKTWVYDASFSPDGKNIITASADKTAKIWDAQSGALLMSLNGHKDNVWDAGYSPDGKKAITVSWDSTVKIWETQSGAILKTITGFTGFVESANFSPDGKMIVTTDDDSTCKIWNAVTGSSLFELKKQKPFEYGAGFISACFSPDGKKVIGVSMDTTAVIWDLQSRRILFTLRGHSDRLTGASFSPDGKMILTASEDATVNIWNAENAKLLASLKGHEGEVRSARFSPDGKKIVTASWDNTAKVWDARSGKLLYTFFALDSSDYFLQIPEGYYFCTPDAAKLLHYTNKDLKLITFEQLDIRYNRPDLVLQGMECPDTALIRSYRKVWQKRMKKLDFDTTQLKGGFHVPETSIPDRDNISYDQTSNKLPLKIKAQDDSQALDRFNVWINKVPLFGVKGISLKSRTSLQFDTTISITLSEGTNRIETSVTNTSGLESYHEPLDVKYTSARPVKQHLYFIGIGIDHFYDKSHDLLWSVKDIRDLAVSLQKKYGADCSIDTLFDNEVTTERVMSLKNSLLKTTVNDKVIVAYSGHGLLSKDYDYFLSTYRVDFQDPGKDGLPYETLEQLLDSIPAREKLMLIDACHSGEVDKEEMQQYQEVKTKLDAAGIQKGVVLINKDSSRLGMKNSVELMQGLFVNLGKNTGATIISAASGTQFALEKNNLKNGVFTYTLLEYMQQHNHATVKELREYVNQRVPELTAGMQSPTTRTENIELNWEVW